MAVKRKRRRQPRWRKVSLGEAAPFKRTSRQVRMRCTVGVGLMPGHFRRDNGRWHYDGPKDFAPIGAKLSPWQHPVTRKPLPGKFVQGHVTSTQVRRALERARKRGQRAECRVREFDWLAPTRGRA